MQMETKEIQIIRAKTVVLATGGAGRMHYQGFPTSNHYGATADGLVLGYRAGAKLLHPDAMQYHPTGVAAPKALSGALVTEKVRALGAKLVNARGEVFVSPLETRDVVTAAILRECERQNGVETDGGIGVWLDTPMIEMLGGAGTIAKRLPAMLRMFAGHGIDIRKEPILVYPTLHYQNGGLAMTPDAMSADIENLFVAGEVAGGIHGRNRLMGNALLDIIVFGRTAGQNAAKAAKFAKVGALTLAHLTKFEEELVKGGIKTEAVSPRLFPDDSEKR